MAVAAQMCGSSPFLVLHDLLEGLHEGDGLAIMRAVQEQARCACALCTHACCYRVEADGTGSVCVCVCVWWEPWLS